MVHTGLKDGMKNLIEHQNLLSSCVEHSQSDTKHLYFYSKKDSSGGSGVGCYASRSIAPFTVIARQFTPRLETSDKLTVAKELLEQFKLHPNECSGFKSLSESKKIIHYQLEELATQFLFNKSIYNNSIGWRSALTGSSVLTCSPFSNYSNEDWSDALSYVQMHHSATPMNNKLFLPVPPVSLLNHGCWPNIIVLGTEREQILVAVCPSSFSSLSTSFFRCRFSQLKKVDN